MLPITIRIFRGCLTKFLFHDNWVIKWTCKGRPQGAVREHSNTRYSPKAGIFDEANRREIFPPGSELCDPAPAVCNGLPGRAQTERSWTVKLSEGWEATFRSKSVPRFLYLPAERWKWQKNIYLCGWGDWTFRPKLLRKGLFHMCFMR